MVGEFTGLSPVSRGFLGYRRRAVHLDCSSRSEPHRIRCHIEETGSQDLTESWDLVLPVKARSACGWP